VVSTPASSLVRTSSLCARCPVEVEGRRYRVNLICLPLQDVGSDPRDGLTLYKPHPYRLPREEVVVSRFRGARVGVSSGGGEGDSVWRAMLHNLRPYGSGGKRGTINYTCGASV